MGSQYVGDDSAFPEDFTIPDSSDPREPGSINVALEALGDRTAFLDRHVRDTGVLAIRSGSVLDMQDLTGMTSGSVYLTAYGIFVFDSGSSATPDGITVVLASDPGRWLLQQRVRNQILAMPSTVLGADFDTTSTSEVDVITQTITDVAIGDVIDVRAVVPYSVGADDISVGLFLLVSDGSSSQKTGVDGAQTQNEADDLDSVPLSARFASTVNGTVTVKLRAKTGGDTLRIFGNASGAHHTRIDSMHIRP